MACGRIVTTFPWPVPRARIFFPCSPRSKSTKGGEPMMIATLLVGAASLSAMVAGYVAMARE
jgi:hypothetical protein